MMQGDVYKGFGNVTKVVEVMLWLRNLYFLWQVF